VAAPDQTIRSRRLMKEYREMERLQCKNDAVFTVSPEFGVHFWAGEYQRSYYIILNYDADTVTCVLKSYETRKEV